MMMVTYISGFGQLGWMGWISCFVSVCVCVYVCVMWFGGFLFILRLFRYRDRESKRKKIRLILCASIIFWRSFRWMDGYVSIMVFDEISNISSVWVCVCLWLFNWMFHFWYGHLDKSCYKNFRNCFSHSVLVNKS